MGARKKRSSGIRRRAAQAALEEPRRLEHLYRVSTVLATFETVERDMPQVLALVSEVVPLRTAALVLDLPGTPVRIQLWYAPGASPSRREAALTHAQLAYGPVRGKGPVGPLDVGAPSALPGPPAPDRSAEEPRFDLVPLVAPGGRIFGVLQLEGISPIDDDDLAFAVTVVNHLAITLDRQRAIEARRASAEAEARRAEAARARAQIDAETRRAEREQRFLADISKLLGASLEVHRTLSELVRAAVPLLADVCVADQVDADGRFVRIEVAIAPAGKRHLAEKLRRFPPSAERATPEQSALRSGKAVLLEDVPLREVAVNAEHARLLEELGLRSIMAVPMIARGRLLGVLAFGSAESGRRFGARELALAEEVGRRTAMAVDNARLYEQATRATAARQELLAIVSHDLRSPLTAVLIGAQLLREAPLAAEEARHVLGRIQRAAERASRLVADLLDLASIESGQFTVAMGSQALAPILEEAVEVNRPAALAAGTRLELERPPSSMVRCDRERVLQVLANLIGNAIKFTPHGGRITVRGEARAGEAIVCVCDTGPGISGEALPHVFDRYWQAKRAGRAGAGLGLAIAQGLVRAHGGTIWVESTFGAGTTFCFTLPLGG